VARTLPLPIDVVCGVVVLPSFAEVEQVQVMRCKPHTEGETPRQTVAEPSTKS
jgi:hypothetical protein